MPINDADLIAFIGYAARELLDADERDRASLGLAAASGLYAFFRYRNLLRLYSATWRPHRADRIRVTLVRPAAHTFVAPAMVRIEVQHAVAIATYTITAN